MASRGKTGGDDVKFIPKYYLDLHLGVQLGPAEALLKIVLGDRILKDFTNNPITESTIINIDDQNLFGGLEREGGVGGSVAILLGHDTQVIPFAIAKIMDDSLKSPSDPYPHHRGKVTLFFSRYVKSQYNGMKIADLQDVLDLYDTSTREGFYWSANNRVIKPIKVETATFAALNEEYAQIARYPNMDDRTKDTAPWDDNPAHIVRRLMIDRNFGAGVAQPHFNEESFRIAAKILHTEGLGITYPIFRSAEMDKIINDVLRHIDAFCYEDGRTGQMSIRLLRPPTDAELKKFPEATPANSKVTAFKVQGEELINQLDVTHTRHIKFEDVEQEIEGTNPDGSKKTRLVRKAVADTNRDDSVTVQDLAGMTSDSGVIAESRSYLGIYNPAMAQKIAERDLIAAAYPLAFIEIDLFNEFTNLSPGDILRVSSPEDSPYLLNMRVMNITESLDGGKFLRANLAEDAYSRSEPPVYPTPIGELERDHILPTNEYEVKSITLPYIIDLRAGIYEERFVHFAALVSTSQIGVTQFLIAEDAQSILGNPIENTLGVWSVVGRGLLKTALPGDIVSTPDRYITETQTNDDGTTTENIVDFFDTPNSNAIGTDDIMMLFKTDGMGNPILDDRGNQIDEMVGIKTLHELNDDGTIATDANGKNIDKVVLIRGLFDTKPQNWNRGDTFYILPKSAFSFDNTRRETGEDVDFRIYLIGSGGLLPDDVARADQAARTPFKMSDRPHRPYRPANVKVGGQVSNDAMGNQIIIPTLIVPSQPSVGYDVPMGFNLYTRDPRQDNVLISWANRNRITDNSIATRWDSLNHPPEPEQRTLIELIDITTGENYHQHLVEPAASGNPNDYPLSYVMDRRYFRSGKAVNGADKQHVMVRVSSVWLNPDFNPNIDEDAANNPKYRFTSLAYHDIQVTLAGIKGHGRYIGQPHGI